MMRPAQMDQTWPHSDRFLPSLTELRQIRSQFVDFGRPVCRNYSKNAPGRNSGQILELLPGVRPKANVLKSDWTPPLNKNPKCATSGHVLAHHAARALNSSLAQLPLAKIFPRGLSRALAPSASGYLAEVAQTRPILG